MAGNNNDNPTQWFKFLNYDPADRKICKKELRALMSRTIEVPEALGRDEIGTVNDGDAYRQLEELCHIEFKNDNGSFICRAWMNVFSIHEPVIQEYVWEFLATVDFEEQVTSMTENCLFFQLGGVRREMNMRQFISGMGLYCRDVVDSQIFQDYYSLSLRERPHNYNPAAYYQQISGLAGYESRNPPSYKTVMDPIRRLVHRLLAVSVRARHSAREKMTVEDLFLMETMDGGDFVDIPWYLAKFMTGKAKGAQQGSFIQGAHFIGTLARSFVLMSAAALAKVNRTAQTSSIGIAKLDEFGIITYNPLNKPVLSPVMRRASGEGSSRASGSRAAAEERVRVRPTMTIMEKMNVMDGRMGRMEMSMANFGNDMDDMTAVISGMNKQFDSFCTDFRNMQVQQTNYYRWNAARTSQMLEHMHLSHPRWNGPDYVYQPNMPGMGVQHGVSFMHPGTSSTTPQDPYDPSTQFDTPMEHDHDQE